MSKIKKEILITGGAGFVGTNLINLFLKKTKFDIISLDNYSSSTKKNHIKNNRVKYIKGHTKNIAKLILLTGTPKWSDAVHLRPNSVTDVLTKIKRLNVVEATIYSELLEKLSFENAHTNITEFPKILIQY